jgi:hypothetical protein
MMSKPKVHVLIPFTTIAACGVEPYNNACYREQVTCKKCKKSDAYKNLRNQPKVK